MPVLKNIYRYPIKGLSAQPLARVELEANVIGTAPAIKRRSALASVHALPVLATLAAVALASETFLWTRDKRLHTTAQSLSLAAEIQE